MPLDRNGNYFNPMDPITEITLIPLRRITMDKITIIMKQGKSTKGTVVYNGEEIPSLYLPKPLLGGNPPQQITVTIEGKP